MTKLTEIAAAVAEYEAAEAKDDNPSYESFETAQARGKLEVLVVTGSLRLLVDVATAARELVGYVNTGGGAITFHCPFCGVMTVQGEAHRDDCDLIDLMERLKALE